MKCICGNRAELQYLDTPVRVDKIVVVKNVPAYSCNRCREEILSGPTSLRLADRAKIAIEQHLDEIEF